MPHGVFPFTYEDEILNLKFTGKARIYFPTTDLFNQNLPDVKDPIMCPFVCSPRVQWGLAAFLNINDPRLSNYDHVIKRSVFELSFKIFNISEFLLF